MPGWTHHLEWPTCPTCGGADICEVGVIHHREGCPEDPFGLEGQTDLLYEKPKSPKPRTLADPVEAARLRSLRSIGRVA